MNICLVTLHFKTINHVHDLIISMIQNFKNGLHYLQFYTSLIFISISIIFKFKIIICKHTFGCFSGKIYNNLTFDFMNQEQTLENFKDIVLSIYEQNPTINACLFSTSLLLCLMIASARLPNSDYLGRYSPIGTHFKVWSNQRSIQPIK